MLTSLLSLFAFPPAQQVADKWAQRAGAAGQAYADGVQRTQKDPTALAAAQASKMLNGVTQAVTSGRWQRRLAEVGATGWKAAVAAKGAQNYATGVTAGHGKYQAGYAAFANAMSGTLDQVLNMPKNTIADSVARASAWITAAHNYKLNK